VWWQRYRLSSHASNDFKWNARQQHKTRRIFKIKVPEFGTADPRIHRRLSCATPESDDIGEKNCGVKQLQLLNIHRMNVEPEVVKSFGDNAPEDFQKKHTSLLVEKDRINCDLADCKKILQAQAVLFIAHREELQVLTTTVISQCRHS
jgi:hypothetical protein